MVTGEDLKMMREALGFSQKDVAKETYLSLRTIIRVERGDSVSPSALHHLFLYFRDEFAKRKRG